MLSLLSKKIFKKLVAPKKAIGALSTRNYLTTLIKPSEDEKREFMALYPDLVGSLTEFANQYQSKDAAKLYVKAFKYNVTTGKYNQGLNMVPMFKILANETHLNPENIKLAHYLGWCIEMVLSVVIILDDIQDGSITRYGKPCWYTLEDVGLIAINDSLMILSGIYHILKENFSQKDYYVKLLELLNESIFILTLGLSMDNRVSKSDVTSLTMDTYKAIALNKSSSGYYLPIALAMHLGGFTDPKVFRLAKTMLNELGIYLQINNDVDDCFGDIERTGKIGTDIQENKCTWLSVVCMEKASEAQKDIMRECYGKADPVKVAQVKRLYEELELQKEFHDYKQETFDMIKTRIQQESAIIPENLRKKLSTLIQFL